MCMTYLGFTTELTKQLVIVELVSLIFDNTRHVAFCPSVRLSVSISLCMCLSQLVTSQCTATLLQMLMLILINFRCWSPFAIARSVMHLYAALLIADWSQHPSWLANQVNSRHVTSQTACVVRMCNRPCMQQQQQQQQQPCWQHPTSTSLLILISITDS